MNYFYVPPEDWISKGSTAEIKGQEAQHISRVLRHKAGDMIMVLDGEGGKWKCTITETGKNKVAIHVEDGSIINRPDIKKVIAFGAIKKRDRLEFAVEKAVELGASDICIFNADHSERSKLNEDRLQLIVISAFKQSGRSYIPELTIKESLDDVLDQYHSFNMLMAHEETSVTEKITAEHLADENLLLVGPEGGFSDREISLQEEKGGKLVSLGRNRLRAETAVLAILSQLLFTD